ncbi:ankyrin [Hypoxylon sp. NC0597]|nr:ankyrin [Hypoxylon sp. NC0597]
MATRTPKIPQTSWDHHKETILSLYITEEYSLPRLVQAMDEDHGFSATASQFEAQLKVWNARKNLKRHEWEAILKKIDGLASQGIRSRVVISGHPVSMSRLDRARRYCKGECHSKKRRRMETDLDDATNQPDTSDVFIETQDQNGNWSRYTAALDANVTPHQRQMSSSAALDPDTREQLHDEHVGQIYNGSTDYQDYENIDLPTLTNTPPELSSFHVSGLTFDHWLAADENENVIQSMSLSFAGPAAQVSQLSNQHDPFTSITFPSLELMTRSPPADLSQFCFWAMCLKDLPFESFERELELRRLTLAIRPSPMQDSRLLSGAQKLTTMFIADAAAAMTDLNERSLQENLYTAAITLQTLDSIVPRAQREYGENGMTRSQQEITEIELHRLLLFSTANGFIGLDNIPIETVFRFFSQNSNLTSLLSRLFRDCPGHVAKSLAENLFRAAIESGDDQAVKFLLQSGLVDVNNTLCFSKGEKYTPIQRAAELQELKVVRELLRFKPDVDKTFPWDKKYASVIHVDRKSALGCLIDGRCPDAKKRNHSPFSPEYLETVDTLIEAGAEVRASFIWVALKRFARMELAKKLIPNLAPSNHSGVVSEDIMAFIAAELSDEDAKAAVDKILSDCEKVGCKRCVSRFSYHVNRAIVEGAKRGHIQFVQSLFRYAESPTQILSAAIRGGNRKLIEFVLAQKPDIRQAPAEHLASFGYPRYTTPLAEAIDAKDSALIEILREEGAFENLHNIEVDYKKSPFRAAISAAAGAGDAEYVKKLLSYRHCNTEPISIIALAGAIKSQREDIVRLLLCAKVDGVVEQMVATPAEIEQFYQEIIKCGNKAIVSTLMAILPLITEVNSISGPDSVYLEMFNICYESGLPTRDFFTSCLRIATKRADRIMLHQCLGAGADVTQFGVLESAVEGQLDILQILLKHIPPTKTCIRNLGIEAVKKAITQGRAEALEMLLNCRAIDFKSIDDRHAPVAVAMKQEAASRCRDFPLTTRLLNAGCDINGIVAIPIGHQGFGYMTPLLVAIEAGSNDLTKFLIDRGADINKEAAYGIRHTPLQAAAKKGGLDTVELLLDNGADINGKPAEFSGGTALQCAAMGGNCNIAMLLLNRGASLDAPPSTFDGRWPLEGAAEHGRLDMIQFLWNVRVIGFPIEQCRKAMKLAEEKGHGACKDLILELAVSSGIMPALEGSG